MKKKAPNENQYRKAWRIAGGEIRQAPSLKI